MGLSQQKAAEMLDMSKQSIRHYEVGHRRDGGRAVVIPRTVELACLALSHGLPNAAPPRPKKAVRIDITMPQDLLRAIDEGASILNESRSGFIAIACETRIGWRK